MVLAFTNLLYQPAHIIDINQKYPQNLLLRKMCVVVFKLLTLTHYAARQAHAVRILFDFFKS